jgi:hypothetical protein
MIFERRAYRLRPGRLQDFWGAQRKWNVSERAASILGHNLSYFGGAFDDDQVVHLYRFESLEQWKQCYDEFYRAQLPDYFTTVRPWVLEQEIALFVAPPIEQLTALWLQDTPALPEELGAHDELEATELIVVEEILDFVPGGLPAFWDAYQQFFSGAGELANRYVMGSLVSLIGRLHRVLTYRCFRSLAQAREHAIALRSDPHWQVFAQRSRDAVVASQTALLSPSPVPEQRSLFERPRPERRSVVPGHPLRA